AKDRQPVAELVLPNLHVTAGVQGPERVGDLENEAPGGRAEETDPEQTVHLAAGRDRPFDAGLDLLERWFQVITEGPPDRRELHTSTRSFEQQGAEPPFEVLDRLADSRGRYDQPLGGATEVQFVGERQKDLDLTPLHRLSSRLGSLPLRLTNFATFAIVRNSPLADR
ncbi:MAG TPA: hypothetical protein VNO51_12625, partial [Ilumatobacteraceae bacterium]|nr:hypothetical protein [Ilumatobacteraceae bacterium]